VSQAPRLAIVAAATPTSNGDLHVGHMAGPYLAADVYSRYLMATGSKVIYTTCTDDSQTYVITAAHRQHKTPGQLCAASTAAIRATLGRMGLSLAGLPPIDDRYRATVTGFFTALHRGGRLRPRTVRLPYARRSGTYLYDALLTGTCPACLNPCSGGVCEDCGHPNNFDELLDPHATLDPSDPVTYRERTILVLPMEEYRDRITAYMDRCASSWRPRSLRLVQDLLAGRLPDVPITIPGTWGIPAAFPETPGQVLYPWVEAMPAMMYSTWWSAFQQGEQTRAVDEHWRAERGAELVYFHGYDNVYHWVLMDLVLLMAHGDRYVLPAGHICNEFYELDGEKFSTSRGHLIWTADLLAEVPRDLARFYLSLTGPEFQRTSFNAAELRRMTSQRLAGPWNRVAEATASVAARAPAGPLPTSPDGRRRATAIADEFRRCYELRGFSPARAAGQVLDLLSSLAGAGTADAVPGGTGRLGHQASAAAGDLLIAVRALLAGSAPMLIDTAARAAATGVDVTMTSDPPAAIEPFGLPPLPGERERSSSSAA
jgi:methionyl-tRNA synthetase